RVLRGAEWELFRASLSDLWDRIEASFDEDLVLSSIEAFDSLQPGQKLAMLAVVSKALCDEKVPTPELTALSEATLAAVYQHVLHAVECEIESQIDLETVEPSVFWRQALLAACREAQEEWEEPLPEVTCDDLGEWQILLGCLQDRVFWDEDYVMASEFLDADPVKSRAQMKEMGIAEDYFLATAPDPNDEQLLQIRLVLLKLTS